MDSVGSYCFGLDKDVACTLDDGIWRKEEAMDDWGIAG